MRYELSSLTHLRLEKDLSHESTGKYTSSAACGNRKKELFDAGDSTGRFFPFSFFNLSGKMQPRGSREAPLAVKERSCLKS
jgi:hypothetical protein